MITQYASKVGMWLYDKLCANTALDWISEKFSAPLVRLFFYVDEALADFGTED